MLTFSKLERKGNLGNQLFQIASTIGLAKEHNHEFEFPVWKYNSFFNINLPKISDAKYVHLNENFYHHHTWDIGNDNYDLEGWLQSEKYFDVPYTKKLFTFKDEFIRKVKSKYVEAFKKQTILLSIRRGDFVAHSDYYQLPIKYYINALTQNFNDWKNYNLIILSDDIEYCKFHFGFLTNVFFGDGLNGIQQLCLGSLCNHFIISNSTFSWWSAWIGETKNSKIIIPIQNFRDQKAKEMDDKDYFPDRWTAFNYLDYKVDINANFYIEKNDFLDRITKNYISNYFNIASISYIDSINNHKSLKVDEINICSRNKIIPPLAVYETYYQLKNTVGAVKCNYNNTVKINYNLNYDTFVERKDFGVFASVFNSKRHSETNCLIGYNGNTIDSDSEFTVNIVGEFSNYVGYSYYLKLKKRKLIIYIKKSIKRLLKIKKH